MMGKKYVSVDIESSGLIPRKYSMLSLGACIVGDTDSNFYRELKPISRRFGMQAMKIGCLGLECLKDYKDIKEFNPKSASFKPELVLDVLKEKGRSPKEVMQEFADWIKCNTKGFRPIEAAAPIKFDGMFTAWYFENFNIINPFGNSGEDINSLYRGFRKDLYVHTNDLRIKKNLPHNALEDAIIQARRLEKVLDLMGVRYR